jgi:hypothetical protein
MLERLRRTRFVWLALLLSIGCERDTPAPGPASKPATAPAASRQSTLQSELVYTRAGGFIGMDDRVWIQPDGKLRAKGKTAGERTGQLSAAQLSELTELLADWPKLEVTGKTPEGAADYFTLSVTYAGKTVSWTSLTPDVPAELKRLAHRIEELARPGP